MRPRHVTGWLAAIALVLSASALRADVPPDPLRLVPDQANLVFKVEQPKKIADLLVNHELARQVRSLEAVQELYDSTNVRRFFQLLGYFEKRLGMSSLEMLDRLAGGGIVVALQIGGSEPPALAVIQGRDEAAMTKFFGLALEVLDQELGRQDIKGALKKVPYRDVPVVQVDKARFAQLGSTLLLANSDEAMKRAIDCHKGSGKSVANVPALTDARQSLDKNPLAWVWLHLAPLQAKNEFKQGIKTLTLQPLFFAFWPMLDVIERTPSVCAGIYEDGNNFQVSVRMARGRTGMSERAALLMPVEEEATTLPLLKPENALASLSFHLDLGKFWQNRAKLVPGKQENKQLDQLEKASALFLGGVKLSTLLNQAGVHHRIVAAQQIRPSYKTVPAQPLPALGWIVDMRDPAFARSMETILRGAGLLASTQANLKMVEEKHGPHAIVSYHFPEDKEFKGDTNGFRFNFSPAFVKAGDCFIVSSTVELARELADIVSKESKTQGGSTSTRWQFYAAGGAAALRAAETQLKSQYILGRALSPKDAQDQVRQLIALVERLGILSLETNYGPDDFRLDIRLNVDAPRQARD